MVLSTRFCNEANTLRTTQVDKHLKKKRDLLNTTIILHLIINPNM